MVALARKTGRSVGLCRASVEIFVIIAGFLLGGQVGIGTVICAVGLGSLFNINFHLLHFQAAELHQENVAEVTFKSKTEWTEEHKAFLALASVSTPRLLIMRELALSDPAFNRHYLEALRKGEISPIPDNTVFKPSSFPKEIRAMLECSDVDLISIETAEDHLILRKI